VGAEQATFQAYGPCEVRILSLCDYTGNMVRPWHEAGHEVMTVDLQGGGHPWNHANMDVVNVHVQHHAFDYIFAFPPCTHLAVSGAKHFKVKGMDALIEALTIVNACRKICEQARVGWMLENPVSTLSTYWRKPDHIFHPYEYGGYEGGGDDGYTKKTCPWTGGGFVMPEKRPIPLAQDHDRIHKAPPSADRANFRSATPQGFARAVFEANSAQ
jgi:hypothetical protein